MMEGGRASRRSFSRRAVDGGCQWARRQLNEGRLSCVGRMDRKVSRTVRPDANGMR